MQTSNDILQKKGITVDTGVQAVRIQLDAGESIEVSCAPDELMWVAALEGNLHCSSNIPSSNNQLMQGESSLMLWPKSPWSVSFNAGAPAAAAIFGITLDALHRILAVEFESQKQSGVNRMDYRKLARLVHLSPMLVRSLERLFIGSEQSMFKSIAQRGIFLNAFAQMLELVYGNDIDQCPFHIDSDTERKIRAAQQCLVTNLQEPPDLQNLSLQVDLPKPVLKEGFAYLYGKSIPAYVQDYKFEKATTMLESGKYLIKEVAFAIGYQNPSHFISAFKQRYGTTPKQWLKQPAGPSSSPT